MIYMARFILELAAPLHCGGGEDNGFDQPVIRDAFGLYRIPGSTVAGLLRLAARRRFSPEEVDAVFGHIATDLSDVQGSRLWCHDARLLDFDGESLADQKKMSGLDIDVPLGPYLRDHVRLEMPRADDSTRGGTAETAGKFDEEYVPVGARFVLEFFLDGWTAAPAPLAVDMFLHLCAAVAAGRIQFGGKSAEGFGEVKALKTAIRRFDLKSEAGLRAWLNLEDRPDFYDGEGEPLALPSLEAVTPQKSDFISGRLLIPLIVDGPLLIGGGVITSGARQETDDQEADLIFYSEPYFDYTARKSVWRRVVPGSSLRGLLRHLAGRAVLALTGSNPAAAKLLDGLFGAANSDDQGRPGKLTVADIPLPPFPREAVPCIQHVAIDRFTGGALDAHLYSEAPIWQADLELGLRIGFENLTTTEAAILAQALTDVLTGLAALGAGGNRGHGFFRLKGLGPDDPCEALQNIQGRIHWNGEHWSPAEAAPIPANWLARLDEALGSLEGHHE